MTAPTKAAASSQVRRRTTGSSRRNFTTCVLAVKLDRIERRMTAGLGPTTTARLMLPTMPTPKPVMPLMQPARNMATTSGTNCTAYSTGA